MQHNTTVYLDGLARLAGRSFPSTSDAVDGILRLLSEQLGTRSCFLTHVIDGCHWRVTAAYNVPGG